MDEVGPISWSGLCWTCAEPRMIENATGIHEHSGPAFQRWRRGMAASVLAPEVLAVLEREGFFSP